MKKDKREKVLVDKQLQTALAKRVVMYWSVTWLAVFTLPILVRTFTNEMPFSQLSAEIIGDFWFPIAISLFVLPIVIWDSFRFSSRIAGPVQRVGQSLRDCQTKHSLSQIQIRENDFCHELVDSVNELVEMMAVNNQSAPNQTSKESVV